VLICCVDYVEDYLVVEEGGSVKENFVYNSMFSTFYCISMTIVASNMTFDLVFVHVNIINVKMAYTWQSLS
jgi:hypothetical protein